MSEKKAKILTEIFFSCAGKIAKADGTVSEDEIKATESLMERFTLNEKYRECENVFRKAKDSKRPIEEDFKELAKLIQYDSTVGQSFLGGLFISFNQMPRNLTRNNFSVYLSRENFET